MTNPRSEPPVLQLHGPRFPSDLIEVFGTTTALERLINALIDAVNVGPSRCVLLDADGSEFEVQVARLDGARRDEDWRRSGSPYFDVDDPVVARILDLTEENARLRQTIRVLKGGRKAGVVADFLGVPGASDGLSPPA